MTLRDALPLGIFALAYLVLARGNLPPLRLDRAGAALVGAVAMVVSGAVSPERPVRGRARPRSDGAPGSRATHPRPHSPRTPAGPGGGHGRALERREQR